MNLIPQTDHTQIRRGPSSRSLKANDNSENAPTARTSLAVSAKAHVVRGGADNMLKQGAKRTALSDVSNRVPIASTQAIGKATASTLAKRSSLTRPARREVLQPARLPALNHYNDDLVEDASDGGDMEVDALDSLTATTEVYAHVILPGAPVQNPVYTKGDTLQLQRVVEVFVDEWDEWGDISMVQEYADDIFTYMHKLEVCINFCTPDQAF